MRGNLLTGFHEQVLTQASSSARQQSRRSQSFRVSPVLDSIPSGPPSRGSEVSATRSLRSSEGTGVVVGDQEAGAAIVVAVGFVASLVNMHVVLSCSICFVVILFATPVRQCKVLYCRKLLVQRQCCDKMTMLSSVLFTCGVVIVLIRYRLKFYT